MKKGKSRPTIDIVGPDKSGRSPFLQTCANGHLEIAKLLVPILAPQHLNAADKSGATPLSVSAENSHHEVVKLLLKFGCPKYSDVMRIDPKKWNPENLKLSTEWKNLVIEFFLACQTGDIERVKQIAPDNLKSIDFNYVSEQDKTPLTAACEGGHFAVVEYLKDIEAVDFNLHDQNGWTPLKNAIERNLTPMAALIGKIVFERGDSSIGDIVATAPNLAVGILGVDWNRDLHLKFPEDFQEVVKQLLMVLRFHQNVPNSHLGKFPPEIVDMVISSFCLYYPSTGEDKTHKRKRSQ